MTGYPEYAAFVGALSASTLPSDRDFAHHVGALPDRDHILEYVTDVMIASPQGSRAWRHAWMVWKLVGGWGAAW